MLKKKSSHKEMKNILELGKRQGKQYVWFFVSSLDSITKICKIKISIYNP